MRTLLFLHPLFFLVYILIALLLPLITKLEPPYLFVVVVLFALLAFILFPRRDEVEKIYIGFFVFFTILNMLDVVLTSGALRNTINADEINPFINSLYRNHTCFIIFFVSSKILFFLLVLAPWSFLRRIVISSETRFRLLTKAAIGFDRKEFVAYLNSEIIARVRLRNRNVYRGGPDISEEYIDYAGTYLINMTASAIPIFSIFMVLLTLNNLSFLLFHSKWILYIWVTIGLVIYMLYVWLFRDRLIRKVYDNIFLDVARHK